MDITETGLEPQDVNRIVSRLEAIRKETERLKLEWITRGDRAKADSASSAILSLDNALRIINEQRREVLIKASFLKEITGD